MQGDILFWTGGKTGAAVGSLFTNWANGRPADGAERCLSMKKGNGGLWYSTPCTQQNAFVCSGPPAQDPQAPDAHDCATLKATDGKWRSVECGTAAGFVCETVDSQANARLDDLAMYIRDDFRSRKPRVSHVTFQQGVTLTDPFARFGDRMGLRECVDVIKPTKPAQVLSGLEIQEYDQVYHGVRVQGRGYKVARDPQTHFIRSFTGAFEHNIDVSYKPVVTEPDAYQKVVAQLSALGYRQPPKRAKGSLAIWPKRQGPSHLWEVAWVFSLPTSSEFAGYDLAVSGLDGAVLGLESHTSTQCPQVQKDAYASTPIPLTVVTYPESQWDDPTTSVASHLQNATSYPYALYATTTVPRVSFSCDPQNATHPGVIVLDTDHLTLGNEPMPQLNLRAASIYTAVQTCLNYYDVLTPGWRGIDGIGAIDIDLRLLDPGLYSSLDDVAGFYPTDPPYIYFPTTKNYRASLDTPCHELSHALWFAAGINSAGSLETKSIDEGFATALASATEWHVREPDQGEWCAGGDLETPVNSSCLVDFANPANSTESGCTFKNANDVIVQTQCPRDYHDPAYCFYPKQCNKKLKVVDECCDEHGNGELIAQWFYKLVNGDTGTNFAGCRYSFEPLDSNPRNAADRAAKILFSTIHSPNVTPGMDFPAFAQATALTAGVGSEDWKKVIRAWYAIGVYEELDIDPNAAKFEPHRGDKKVYPWTTFVWPIQSDGQNSEPWDSADVRVEWFDPDLQAWMQHDVSSIAKDTRNGKPVGVLNTALPFNKDGWYFWRVRPSPMSDEAWKDCYVWNAFEGTTEPTKVTDIGTDPPLAAGEKLKPGAVFLHWNAVSGARRYRVFADTSEFTDEDCSAHSPLAEVAADESEPVQHALVPGFVPNVSYWVRIQPIGPRELLTDVESVGKCSSSFVLSTGGMDALSIGPSVRTFGYRSGLFVDSTIQLDITVLEPSITDYVVVGLIPAEVQTSGNCSGKAQEYPIMYTGHQSYIDTITVTIDPGFRNPAGYCWYAYAISSNDQSSPLQSEPLPMIRFVDKVMPEAPGNDFFAHRNHQTFRLPNPDSSGHMYDSYGKPVTFQWDADTATETFGVHVGRWHWKDLLADGTSNFIIPNCFDYFCWQYQAHEPEYTFKDISGTSKKIAPESAAEGRFCWQVWPVLPDALGQFKENNQPLVKTDILCYTSGPAKPIWDPASPPIDYSVDKPATIRAHFAYVPDAQFGFQSDHSSLIKVEHACTTDGYVYNDVYDCDVTVTVDPAPGETVNLWAQAWSGEHGELTESNLVWNEQTHVTFKGCGHHTEPCCPPKASCMPDSWIACDHSTNTCEECGLADQTCCHYENGTDCRHDYLYCEKGTDRCRHCGNRGEKCCGNGWCLDGISCDLVNWQCWCAEDGANCHSNGECCSNTCASLRLPYSYTQCGYPCGKHEFDLNKPTVGWQPCCLVHSSIGGDSPHCTDENVDECVLFPDPKGGETYTGCVRKDPSGAGLVCGRSTPWVKGPCCFTQWPPAKENGVCEIGQCGDDLHCP